MLDAASLHALPEELLLQILSHLQLATLRTIEGVSQAMKKYARSVCRSQSWRAKLQNADDIMLEGWMLSNWRTRKLELPTPMCPGAYSPDANGIVALSLHGDCLASACYHSCVVQVWQAPSKYSSLKHLHSLQHDDEEVTCVAIRPGGGDRGRHHRQLVSASRMGSVRLWDLETGEAVLDFTDNGDDAHDAEVFSLVWTDANVLLSGGADRKLQRWCADSGVRLTLQTGYDSVVSLSFDAELDLVASPQLDFSIKLLDAASLRCERALIGHVRPVLAVAMQGGRVASAGIGGCIRLWDARTGACTSILRLVLADGRRSAVIALSLYKDMLITGACGETCVRIWQLREQQDQERFESNDESGNDESRSNGGRVVARLHRPTGAGINSSVCALACDGERVASGNTATSIPALWEV